MAVAFATTENTLPGHEFILEKATEAGNSTGTPPKMKFTPQIKLVWDPNAKTPDTTISFGIKPDDYGLDASWSLNEAWSLNISQATKDLLPAPLRPLAPNRLVMEGSFNVNKFLQDFFGLKASPGDLPDALLGQVIAGKAENKGGIMLPRYYQKWVDDLNAKYPGAKFELSPDLAAKGAGRRYYLYYLFGAKIDRLTDAQLDTLVNWLKKATGKALP